MEINCANSEFMRYLSHTHKSVLVPDTLKDRPNLMCPCNCTVTLADCNIFRPIKRYLLVSMQKGLSMWGMDEVEANYLSQSE